MAQPSKAERISQTRQRIREQIASEPDDAEVQEAVFNPPGAQMLLGGSTVTLYPLCGRSVRTLMGLTAQVFASSSGDGPPALRIGGTLVELYLERFLPLLAESTQPAGTPLDHKQRSKIQQELEERTQSAKGAMELAAAYDIMLAQNDVMEAFVPKSQPAGE